MLDRALALGGRGPYVLQAAIASLHSEDERDRARDRGALRRARPRHRLARRRAEPGGRDRRGRAIRRTGSRCSTTLDLDGYRYLHAARAELLRAARPPGSGAAGADARARARPAGARGAAPPATARRARVTARMLRCSPPTASASSGTRSRRRSRSASSRGRTRVGLFADSVANVYDLELPARRRAGAGRRARRRGGAR